jgi:hypothetical protein
MAGDAYRRGPLRADLGVGGMRVTLSGTLGHFESALQQPAVTLVCGEGAVRLLSAFGSIGSAVAAHDLRRWFRFSLFTVGHSPLHAGAPRASSSSVLGCPHPRCLKETKSCHSRKARSHELGMKLDPCLPARPHSRPTLSRLTTLPWFWAVVGLPEAPGRSGSWQVWPKRVST